MNTQLVILFLYFWVIAGLAQFLSMSAIFSLGVLTIPVLVYLLVKSDKSGQEKYD